MKNKFLVFLVGVLAIVAVVYFAGTKANANPTTDSNPICYNLTASETNTSLVVLKGDNAVTAGNKKLTAGDVVTITATPETGYTLTTFTVNGQPFTSGQTLTVNSNVSIIANSTINTYTIATTAEHATAQILDSNNEVARSLTHGQTYTVSITASTGYNITAITLNNSAVDNNSTFTATGNVTLAVTTALKTYTPSIIAPNATVQFLDSNNEVATTLTHGQTYTVNVIANEGYQVDSITLNGTTIINGDTFTVTDAVTANVVTSEYITVQPAMFTNSYTPTTNDYEPVPTSFCLPLVIDEWIANNNYCGIVDPTFEYLIYNGGDVYKLLESVRAFSYNKEITTYGNDNVGYIDSNSNPQVYSSSANTFISPTLNVGDVIVLITSVCDEGGVYWSLNANGQNVAVTNCRCFGAADENYTLAYYYLTLEEINTWTWTKNYITTGFLIGPSLQQAINDGCTVTLSNSAGDPITINSESLSSWSGEEIVNCSYFYGVAGTNITLTMTAPTGKTISCCDFYNSVITMTILLSSFSTTNFHNYCAILGVDNPFDANFETSAIWPMFGEGTVVCMDISNYQLLDYQLLDA